jgi:colanic acid/amylovoran biosynthesis glycosyltransferase
MQNLLLVLPLWAFRTGSQVLVDAQARNGLRLWLENFEAVTLACPTFYEKPPADFLPLDDDRITFVDLPAAYTPHRFAASIFKMRRTLEDIIDRSTYLHFAIGGLFGDWASLCALIAYRKGRRFAIWTDRVESQVAAFHAKTRKGPKRIYYEAITFMMKPYERLVIKRSSLGLFHGMDCYRAYASFSGNPHLVHNIHLGTESRITNADLNERLRYSGPLRVAYAGRAHRDKGIFDWLEALTEADSGGLKFVATWFGDGPELKTARKLVENLNLSDRIFFVGSVEHSDLITELKSFDLFLFCHKTQESPRCLVEALICGLPLVGYDAPYPCDLISKHGGGKLTPADPQSLADALTQFTAQRAVLTERARLDGENFDADSVFKHRADLMKTIPNRPHSID